MNDLVGKQVYGFKFKKSSLYYSPSMEQHVGKIGTIISYDRYEDGNGDDVHTFRVEFENGKCWSYPYPEILEHLVNDERTVDELLTQMKQLTSELWKTKI
jgi:hypothetical protein